MALIFSCQTAICDICEIVMQGFFVNNVEKSQQNTAGFDKHYSGYVRKDGWPIEFLDPLVTIFLILAMVLPARCRIVLFGRCSALDLSLSVRPGLKNMDRRS